jgi:hypothetical protein
MEKLNVAMALVETTTADIQSYEELEEINENDEEPSPQEQQTPYHHQLKAICNAIHSEVCAIHALQTRRRVHGRRMLY